MRQVSQFHLQFTFEYINFQLNFCNYSSFHHYRQFLNDSDSITKEFVSQVEPTKTTDAELVEDFLPELSRLNLECVCIDGLSSVTIHHLRVDRKDLFFLLSLQWFAIYRSTFGWRVSVTKSGIHNRVRLD